MEHEAEVKTQRELEERLEREREQKETEAKKEREAAEARERKRRAKRRRRSAGPMHIWRNHTHGHGVRWGQRQAQWAGYSHDGFVVAGHWKGAHASPRADLRGAAAPAGCASNAADGS